MGSLSSRPSVPSRPQVVYVSSPTGAATPVQKPAPSAEEPAENTVSSAHKKTLLSRSRGRFGTVQTSFRGLLGLSDQSSRRKTLLGE